MSKILLILFSALTIISGYMTYQGIGLQGVTSQSESKSVRSTGSSFWSSNGSSSSGYSSGK